MIRRILMVAVLAALPCCGPFACDTCSGGKNMGAPAVQSFDSASPAKLTLTWSAGSGKGAELPDSYFAAVKVSYTTDPEVAALITSVSCLSPRQLVVLFADTAAYRQTHNDLAFQLEFPDRADYIACKHAGGPDRYLLDVRLIFAADGSLSGSSLNESVQLGPI